MNFTNLLGTVSAVVAIGLSLMTDVLGCTTNAAGLSVCGASFLSPQIAGYVTMAFAAVVLISKVIRPGGALRGLFGSTAVVVPAIDNVPGTVSAGQVSSGK